VWHDITGLEMRVARTLQGPLTVLGLGFEHGNAPFVLGACCDARISMRSTL
jgi:hypothetical protein